MRENKTGIDANVRSGSSNCCNVARERGVKERRQEKEHVLAVTDECIIKLDYHYHTH